MTADQEDVRDQLVDHGLVVPTRDPNRSHTKSENSCFKVGFVALPGKKGGKAYHGAHPCKGWGCPTCAPWRAEHETTKVQPLDGPGADFVGKEPIDKKFSAYGLQADKIAGWLWVTTVPSPPELVGKVKERLAVRVKRAKRQGQAVEYLVIPCDGVIVVVATADLGERKARGRPPAAPTSGTWVPAEVGQLYVRSVLASTAVNGQLTWSSGWEPDKAEPRGDHLARGGPLATETAARILWSEGYVWDPTPRSGWWPGDDPVDVLEEAIDRAKAFLDAPGCSLCSVAIDPKDKRTKYWWRNGTPYCGLCDLSVDLSAHMTKGRTEREIEAYLGSRRLSFRRHRAFIERALGRLGSVRAPSGIWLAPTAGEKAS